MRHRPPRAALAFIVLVVALLVGAAGCGSTIGRNGQTFAAENVGAVLLDAGRLQVFASADPIELAIDDEFTVSVELVAPDFLALADGEDHAFGDGATITVDRWQVSSFALACDAPERASGAGTLRLDTDPADPATLRTVHLEGRLTRPADSPCADEAPVDLDLEAPVQ